MNGVPIKELNWNPFIYDKVTKEKKYYQRDFVWTVEQNRLLIDSIYNGIDCGKIIVRKRSWKEIENLQKNGETDLAFKDLVDGKQRLNALRGFIQNEYCDNEGNYFGDLSRYAQNKLVGNNLFSFAEMAEETSDDEVLHQFLKLNFSGVPQSQEHLDYVRSLIK